MNTRTLGFMASLALSLGGGTTAQAAADPSGGNAKASSVLADAVVGRWLHGQHGDIIGSVRGLADGGRTAVIMVGAYFQPGSHEARVPARALSVVNGKVTLRAGSVDALNARFRR